MPENQRNPCKGGAVHRCVRPFYAVSHGPLALMGSADRGLIKSSGSKPANLLRLLSIRRVDRLRHHVSSRSQALAAAAARHVMPPLLHVGRCPVYS